MQMHVLFFGNYHLWLLDIVKALVWYIKALVYKKCLKYVFFTIQQFLMHIVLFLVKHTKNCSVQD